MAGYSCSNSKSPLNDQKGGSLRVSSDTLHFNSKGDTSFITVKTKSSSIKLFTTSSWINSSFTKEDTTYKVRVIVQKNPANNYRIGNLTIKTSGFSSKKITISQDGKLPKGDGIYIKVANYNIRYNAPADKKTGNEWNRRKGPLADLIRRHHIGIMGTEEGNTSQMKDLMNLLPKYSYIGNPYGGANGHLSTVSIVFKKAEFKVLSKGEFWYSKTPDKKSIGWDATDTRICTWAKIEHQASGQEFYFFASHFYYKGKTAKQHSGKVMVNEIKKINKDHLPVFSTGDLNSNPGSPQIKDISALLNDSYKVTRTPPGGPINTNLGSGIFSPKNPINRIDYVFVNDKVRVLTDSVLTDTYDDGRTPADHLPVVCNVFVKK
jgi:endonuclease/exonuclease/phosphatase family metal-dependent hydrolase